MRTGFRVFFAVIILCALSACSFAVGKITVDPNASGKVNEKKVDTDFWNSDSRLNQKITYSIKNKQVRLILDDLSELTGITLKAGYNVKDWQVRDRRMSIFVKDIPLADVMKSVARVMKFKWSKNDTGDVPTYRLIMDRKQILSAESLKQNSLNRINDERVKRRKEFLAEMTRVAGLSNEDREKLRDENPMLYLYAITDGAAFFADLIRESPAARDAILNGKELVLRSSDLSEKWRSTSIDAMRGIWKRRYAGKPEQESMPDKYVDNASNSIIYIPEYNAQNLNSVSYMGKLELYCEDETFYYHMPSINNPAEKIYCKGTLDCFNEHVTNVEMYKRPEVQSLLGTAYEKINAEFQEICPGEPKIEHADEPWMHEKLKNSIKGKLYDVQEGLARFAGLCIVSDCFGGSSNHLNEFNKDSEIDSVLSKIDKNNNYNWNKNNSIIEFQDRNWFIHRTYQIPDEQIDKWVEHIKRNKILSLDDLAEIALLDDNQFYENIPENELLGSSEIFRSITKEMQSRDFLRLYNALDTTQRTALLTEMNIRLENLSEQQWQLVFRALRRKNAQVILNSDSGLIFSCKPMVAGGGATEYWFKAACIEQEESVFTQWCIKTPKYTQPEKAKPGK